ncbi:hypothetical protein C4E04_16295 [Microvirga sp. 17 mud 1-3]|nr:hypothetical protein C4E04_16295 [Microvirga sp. 17 mud 1-3]
MSRDATGRPGGDTVVQPLDLLLLEPQKSLQAVDPGAEQTGFVEPVEDTREGGASRGLGGIVHRC